MTDKLDVERIRRGLLWSLLAVLFGGVRIIDYKCWYKGKRLRRNSPCPCGSGKKWKTCHGRR